MVGMWLILVNEGQTTMTVCPSKLIYHIPCPGCGVTRATLLLLHGHLLDAIKLNPNCIVSVLFIGAYPFIAIYSLIRKHSFIAEYYALGEQLLKRKYGIGILLLCEALIWIHNIIMHV